MCVCRPKVRTPFCGRPGCERPKAPPLPVQLFVPTYRVDETLAEIRECLERGWTGLGYKTVEFEERWKSYTGLPHAHFLSSATAGLHLALHVLSRRRGWDDGDEVITTPLTFVSTNHAILYEGLQPVFADTDEYLCLDPRSVERSVTKRTRAVVFVGLGGNVGRLDDVADVCRRRGLALILDAAHMAGTRWERGCDDMLHPRYQHVGREADVSVFSFHAVKNLPTADSGMVCFRDPALDAEARRLSWMGISRDTHERSAGGRYSWEYDVGEVGFKYHGNSVMAAMGLVALRHLDEDNARRRSLCALYDGHLSGRVEVVPTRAGCESARHLYQVLVDRRGDVIVGMNGRGVFPGVHYRLNSEYAAYDGAPNFAFQAARDSRRVLSLPLHLRMTDFDVRRVCDALMEVLV